MKKRSLTFNTFIYGFRTIINFIFPLITFPYASRVLAVDSMGKVNFSTSIVSYFSLLAGLGIQTFAIREGAKIREDQEKASEFCSEIFTLNLITTALAYALFLVMLICNKKWHEYTWIMLIISLTIPLTTIGMEWVFAIYEDFFYITVRSVIVQMASVVFLFLFVKNDKDLYMYAVYTVFSAVGANLLNVFLVHKHVNIRLHISKKILPCMKPILILFASAAACQVYLYSDTTILGYLTSDTDVAKYNAAVKVYNLAKNVLLVIGTVSMPRLAGLLSDESLERYKVLFTKLFNVLILLIVPCVVGLLVVGKNAIIIFAGMRYEQAGAILQILAFAVPASILGSFVASAGLVLFGKELLILKATIVAAILNIVLNLLLIPYVGVSAAAMTTVLSEYVAFFIEYRGLQEKKIVGDIRKNTIQTGVASAIMGVVCWGIQRLLGSFLIIGTVCSVMAGAVMYAILLHWQKNDLFDELYVKMKTKILRK